MRYLTARPTSRPLKIYATDPLLGRGAGNRVSILVENERLRPGPQGSRIEVIDYDGSHGCYYPPVDLDDPAVLMQGGLDPAESDPRFHQQMVYACAMRTLMNFDRALGRSIHFRRGRYRRLRIFPHAFHDANAYYDRDLNALLFGYFRADADDPGPNLPGQTVFTCLSHDIVAHETTHAIVDRLRRYFLDATNEDVAAFHEGFSDIVALFQHFSYRGLLREEIQKSRTDLRSRNLLVDLARQFGYASGSGAALRSALDTPDPALYRKTPEPHDRGAILVGAVFDGFFATYQRRIRDLLRIATAGSGVLPAGDLHPDLVNRVAAEASKAAQHLLTMCIRAFDYLPPVDVTFGDFLRAVVTADYEVAPEDEYRLRASLIEGFRTRGIHPHGVISLAEEALLWEPAEGRVPRIPVERLDMLPEMVVAATGFSRSSTVGVGVDEAMASADALFRTRVAGAGDGALSARLARQLHAYATENAVRLLLDPKRPVEVAGFHTSFRVAPNGRLLIELIAQFAQKDISYADRLGGLPLRGGTTLVASVDGTVRYLVAKPLPERGLPAADRTLATERAERSLAFVEACDRRDLSASYLTAAEFQRRMVVRTKFRALHRGGRS
jgi:hypothetical protein